MNGCHYRLFSIVCGPPLPLAGPSLIKSDHVLRWCFANPWNTPNTLQEAEHVAICAAVINSLFRVISVTARCCGDFTGTCRHVANNTAIIDCYRRPLVLTPDLFAVLALPEWTWTSQIISAFSPFLLLSAAFHYFHNVSETSCTGAVVSTWDENQ